MGHRGRLDRAGHRRHVEIRSRLHIDHAGAAAAVVLPALARTTGTGDQRGQRRPGDCGPQGPTGHSPAWRNHVTFVDGSWHGREDSTAARAAQTLLPGRLRCAFLLLHARLQEREDCGRRPRLRRTAGRAVVRQEVRNHRLRHQQAAHRRPQSRSRRDQRGRAGLLDDTRCKFTYDPADLAAATFFIVAVPTPIDDNNRPDLTPLVKRVARRSAPHLKKGDVVVYESTVYPGVTEEVCGPILEELSGLALRRRLHPRLLARAHQPRRQEHTFERITKVVSGQDAETLERVADVYASVVTAGVHRRPTSRSPRPPRSSRTPSATSTSR